MVLVNVRGTEYYMNKKLKANWDAIKDGALAKADDDRCYIVDGRERSGKSLFTIQQAAYIDPTILDDSPDGKSLPRICFTMNELLDAVHNTKSTLDHTYAIIYDESFRGLSSKSALSKQNKAIVQALQEMGQNNLVLFLVSPSFFMIELYAACHRSRTLFHIVKSKKNKDKRMFRVYGEKKKSLLYRMGMKKGHSYCVQTKNKDWFFEKYPAGDEFERRYRKKKQDSLTIPIEEMKIEGITKKQTEKYHKALTSWFLDSKLSPKKFHAKVITYGHEIEYESLWRIIRTGAEKIEKISNKSV